MQIVFRGALLSQSQFEIAICDLKVEMQKGLWFNLILDAVDGSQEAKCGLKYVIFSQSRRPMKLLTPFACSALLCRSFYSYATPR